jgi:hypothetical protein
MAMIDAWCMVLLTVISCDAKEVFLSLLINVHQSEVDYN